MSKCCTSCVFFLFCLSAMFCHVSLPWTTWRTLTMYSWIWVSKRSHRVQYICVQIWHHRFLVLEIIRSVGDIYFLPQKSCDRVGSQKVRVRNPERVRVFLQFYWSSFSFLSPISCHCDSRERGPWHPPHSWFLSGHSSQSRLTGSYITEPC